MPAPPIDLRSDTVTRPSPAMRRAMADAEVGDDVYGEDPTVRHLEAQVAELVGKEAALFVPSGTMANQIALLLHTRRGDLVYASEGTHTVTFESGAGAAWSGVQFQLLGGGGPFEAADLERAPEPRFVEPRAALVVVENTHGASGGRVVPAEAGAAIAAVARGRKLRLHLDGARLWNAAVAAGITEGALAAPFDTVSVCFSKGLGAPVGSALLSTRELVQEGRRFRKMLGGGMRQAGILAAAASYALLHNRARLAEDHENARILAEALSRSPDVRVDLSSVQTNMVNAELASGSASDASAELARNGVLVHAMGPRKLRFVTHLDVGRAEVETAAALTLRVAAAAVAAASRA